MARPRGKPFPNGVSGDSSGRPKQLEELRKLARRDGPEALEKLLVGLHALMPQIAAATPAECPAIMGFLEQLKAQLWAQLCVPQPAAKDGDDELLDMKQAAKILNIPTSRVYELARQGQLPTVKLGKYVRMRRGDLNKWVRGQR